MPYALYFDDTQITSPLPSRCDVWKWADAAGLLVDVPLRDEDGKPDRVLHSRYRIEPCRRPFVASDLVMAALFVNKAREH